MAGDLIANLELDICSCTNIVTPSPRSVQLGGSGQPRWMRDKTRNCAWYYWTLPFVTFYSPRRAACATPECRKREANASRDTT
jgi:hypothetical protein